MAIRRIRVSNYKSFGNLDVSLGNFNVLIGANASGKSNFIQILKFLRDIATDGLENAISLQGGIAYLRNMRIGSSAPLALEVTTNQPVALPIAATMVDGSTLSVRVDESTYAFELRFKEKDPAFVVAADRWTVKARFFVYEADERRDRFTERTLCEGSITFDNVGGEVKAHVDLPEDAPVKAAQVERILGFLRAIKVPAKALLLEGTDFPFIRDLFTDTSVCDFDPKLPQKAVPIRAKAELEEDGSNLALAIKAIVQNKSRRRKLSNLLRDLLPFVDHLDVETFADRSLLFKVKETYFRKDFVPASLISDGTINIAALLIALYFEKKSVTIIEEPDRSVHPYLISRLMGMMKDAARKKQIIVTTHNPQIVKHADLDSLLLVSRDDEGFSSICRPAEKAEVRTFLQNEIGIDELYVQRLLEC